MLAGGNLDGEDQDELTEVVELVTTDSTPSFGQLPSARPGALGAMFGNDPILCGGGDANDGAALDSCISFKNSQWSQSYSMNQKRSEAAGVQINSTTFWILGGMTDSDVTDSTEFIIQGQHNGVPGPKLPYILRFMCVVKRSEEEIWIIGGGSGAIRNDVWIYNPQNGFARNRGPSLNTKRRYHSCSTMRNGEKTLIVVAGGDDGHNDLKSVEIFDPSGYSWHSGNKFP